MKFSLTAILAFALLAVCHAELIDNSTVDDECPGCSSRLDLTMSGAGEGVTQGVARNKCDQSCADDVDDERKRAICFRLCGVAVKKGAMILKTQPKTCQLCDGDSGHGINVCRGIISGMLEACEDGCQTSTPIDTANGFEVTSSLTVTRDFPGNTANC